MTKNKVKNLINAYLFFDEKKGELIYRVGLQIEYSSVQYIAAMETKGANYA